MPSLVPAARPVLRRLVPPGWVVRASPLLLLGVVACARPSDPPPAAPAAAPTVAAPPAETSPPAPAAATSGEVFADFFARFERDTVFQVSRFASPLMLRTFDEDQQEVEEPMPSATPVPLEWNEMEATERRFNDLARPSDLPADADTVTMHLRGTDNGVSVAYVFARSDGQWRLVRVEDFSM